MLKLMTLPRGGSDKVTVLTYYFRNHFNPRSPWGERLLPALHRPTQEHFNPRSPWGERLGRIYFICQANNISIHAPRGGSDKQLTARSIRTTNFNPRSPWGERRTLYKTPDHRLLFQSTLPVGGATVLFVAGNQNSGFQSTLPVGGATWDDGGRNKRVCDFNPRSPWGERLWTK